MSEPVRVLVIDDSALMRKLISQMLERDPGIQVVGTAMDGEFGLKKIEELEPQVVTLDLEMPRMDGMETLRQIMRKHKLPVIIVSSHSTEGAASTFKALALGAFDFVAKPQDGGSAHLTEISDELISKIKAGAKAQPRLSAGILNAPFRVEKAKHMPSGPPTKTVAIGISTGGPNALQFMLSQLPADFQGTILVVQHMPDGFTEMFARRLDECCQIRVKEAQSGDILQAGRALVCPGNKHMRVRRMPMGDVVVLSDEDRVNGHRPSVDVLFNSVAHEMPMNALGVLMTGMGEDGAEGLGALKRSGALTIAQDESSCVVYGMPKVAIEKGFAQRVVSLDLMANTLMAQCKMKSTARA